MQVYPVLSVDLVSILVTNIVYRQTDLYKLRVSPVKRAYKEFKRTCRLERVLIVDEDVTSGFRAEVYLAKQIEVTPEIGDAMQELLLLRRRILSELMQAKAIPYKFNISTRMESYISKEVLRVEEKYNKLRQDSALIRLRVGDEDIKLGERHIKTAQSLLSISYKD